jgi:hypothetical protein
MKKLAAHIVRGMEELEVVMTMERWADAAEKRASVARNAAQTAASSQGAVVMGSATDDLGAPGSAAGSTRSTATSSLKLSIHSNHSLKISVCNTGLVIAVVPINKYFI